MFVVGIKRLIMVRVSFFEVILREFNMFEEACQWITRSGGSGVSQNKL